MNSLIVTQIQIVMLREAEETSRGKDLCAGSLKQTKEQNRDMSRKATITFNN